MIDSMVKTVLANITIKDVLEAINRRYGGKAALRIKEDGGKFREVSFVKLGRRVVSISSALINLGVSKGDRVAILSENRPEWVEAFFGIISCGGIVLPVDAKLTSNEIQFILNDSKARCVFVSAAHIGTIDGLRRVLPHLEKVIIFDKSDRADTISLNKLRPHRGKDRDRTVYPDDTAIIVYTSGTTGVAKGVELSYRSLLFQALSFSDIIGCTPKEKLLSVLPLNHMLEITGGMIAPLYSGSCVTYCDTLKTSEILPIMREVRITAMIAVPLVLKMIHGGIMKRASKLSPAKQKAFNALLALSKFLLKFNIRIGRAVFASVHKEFGGRLHTFISGGAPLDINLELDLNALGFRILQGYGLTETAPVVSVNTFGHNRFGSVGKPLPGVEVRIIKNSETDTEGEILTRGPHVMKGYYGHPENTAEAVKNGWLHTGDLGYTDSDGYLFITGRKKNMIILGGGKKVFPEEVESVMLKSPYIKEICVLPKTADRGMRKGHEQVHAVIVPNMEALAGERAPSAEQVKERMSAEIAAYSALLAPHKRIMSFDVSYEDLPKTASRKIKRDLVAGMVNR